MKLASANFEVVEQYNEKMLSKLSLMGGLLTLLPILSVPFSNTKASAVPAYLLATSLSLAMFLLFRLPVMKKYTLCGLYLCFSGFFLLAIYLSVIHSPNMRATILLGVFCIMPLSFIDRPLRMNLFVAFWFSVHTVLAFHLKPVYDLDDIINCLCFAILGCFFGNMQISVRLKGYEANRLLIIEKETDVVTGLFSRRKLFETLALLETPEAEKPTGVLMIDIDHFKEFNDSYGHAAGDKCLSHFGEVLREAVQNLRLQSFRYGGEEFVAIAYGYDKKELLSIAEGIRIAVQDADMGGHKITVSIGAAYCGDETVKNYEKVIDRADMAAYESKHTGRNRVSMEKSEEKASV